MSTKRYKNGKKTIEQKGKRREARALARQKESKFVKTSWREKYYIFDDKTNLYVHLNDFSYVFTKSSKSIAYDGDKVAKFIVREGHLGAFRPMKEELSKKKV